MLGTSLAVEVPLPDKQSRAAALMGCFVSDLAFVFACCYKYAKLVLQIFCSARPVLHCMHGLVHFSTAWCASTMQKYALGV